ncbi:assimilatory nitrate reductase (ferredoxin) precursor [Halorubrum vacuolatum]|uniref:Assimilatory nitrate reductase (Ferredoxin) n=2 Tax=Halorubrum vacuolatum TaxID=63740 RepID=A0A238WVT6_HALVU|nr:assimilatory nitrate reductase (ferredoxin) precursor [Halorubrum vacuolatum]
MRCAVGCGLRQRPTADGNGLATVRGDPSHVVSRGQACARGVDETADPRGDRLTRPLVRRGGDLVETTWDVALDRAISGFESAVGLDEDASTGADPDALAVIGSGQQTNEAAYALGKVARGGVGTERYDANTTLCMASAVRAYLDAFGSDAPPPTYDDIPEAAVHLIWGANPAVAHPVLFRWIADAAAEAGRELIVVDPVETATARRADRHVRPAFGGDHALARAILARLVEDDRVDREFIDAYTTGFEAVRESLSDPESAAEAAGVDLETVDRLAAAFERRTLVYWGMGVNQSVRGTATAGALIDCCLATGNLGPGCGPFSITGQANSMGARLCASTGTWPGHREFTDPTHRRAVASAWDVPVSRLPDSSGPGPVGILSRRPTALWTVATNPAAGLPAAGDAREVLSETFLVVQDAFRTETVEFADVVLPAATWGETVGTTTNMERRISRIRAATDPPGDARTDLEIIVAIGERLAPGLFDGTGADPEAVFEELTALTAGTPADCSGITYPRLEEGAVRWPAADPAAEAGYRYLVDAEPESDDDTRATGRFVFPTPSGQARFSTHAAAPLPEPVDDAYDLLLTTAREPDGYNTGIRSRDDDPDPPLARINPRTAAESLAVEEVASNRSDGSPIDIVSRRGRVRAILEPDPAVPEGAVWLPIHHPAANDLTVDATDPFSDEPNYKQCAVRIERPTY